jgi:uncharacterized membrane protein
LRWFQKAEAAEPKPPAVAGNGNGIYIMKKIFAIVILSFVFFTNYAFAQILDNFDAYNTGDLNTQGGWAGDNRFKIQGDTIQAGTKAVNNTAITMGQFISISKGFVPTVTGTQVGYIRAGNRGVDNGLGVQFYSGETLICSIEMAGNKIYIAYPTPEIMIDEYSENTWYRFQVEWDSDNNKVRGKINNGDWFGWYSKSDFGELDKVKLFAVNEAVGFWDSFSATAVTQVSYLSIPAASSTDLFSSAGNLTGDLWPILVVAMGVPFGFYIIPKIIALII